MKYSIVKINESYRIAELNTITGKQQLSPEIGRFAQMRLKYLVEEQPELLSEMLNKMTLFRHLQEVEEQSQEQLQKTEQAMIAVDTEYLAAEKAGNLMKMTGLRNNYRLAAEETIRNEIIFS
ncbi:MAG: TnpV protein [Ruminococcus sp.]|nr:TnpV protein [Ruminococcus sp.]